jgi:hypothetical protein
VEVREVLQVHLEEVRLVEALKEAAHLMDPQEEVRLAEVLLVGVRLEEAHLEVEVHRRARRVVVVAQQLLRLLLQLHLVLS